MSNQNLNEFIDTGLDSFLSKSIDKSKLVQKDVIVNGKHGTHIRKQWVNPYLSKPASHKPAEKKPSAQPKKSSLINEAYLYLPNGSKSHKTLEQVVDDFHNYKGKTKYDSLDEFVKDNYFVSTGKNTTVDVYRESIGRYKKERFDSVHKPIIQKILDSGDTPKSRKPICLLYGGGSGSGKSSVADKWIAEPLMKEIGLNFAKVDCDAIKEQLPEHKMFYEQDRTTTALREHRESSDIANTAIDELIKRSKCFRYDGTMSDYDKYNNLIGKLKKNGYEVHIIATDIPVEMALERASGRDRVVDEHVVRRIHRQFGESFLDIAMIEGVDSFRLYDNSQPQGQNPTLVADDVNGVIDNSLWLRFLNKNNQ